MRKPSKKPILFVAFQIPNSANGGIESLNQILQGLTRHRPIVMTNVESKRTASWRDSGIEVHVVPETASRTSVRSAPLGHAAAHWRYASNALRIARSSDASAIFANDAHAMQFMYPLARFGLARIIYCMRSTPDPALRHSAWKYRQFFSASARNLFLSNEMASVWTRYSNGSVEPYSVTYSAVDPAFFAVGTADRATQPTVLLPGRITPAKRQLEYIQEVGPALASAGIKLMIAGDASQSDHAYEDQCVRAAQELGETVEFLGFRTEMERLYAAASVVAIPSRFEGLSRAMIEGLSCGRPVVSFDVCSAREILDGGGGMVVPALDWEAMRSATLAFCTDQARWSRAAGFARARARELFVRDEVIERYEQAFEAVASAR